MGVPERRGGTQGDAERRARLGLVGAGSSDGHAGDENLGGGGGGGSGDLAQAITVLRARIDEEFRIAERIDTKQRQAFAFAAGFFAIVQTVAFGGFSQPGFGEGDRVIVAIVAVVAGLFLIGVAHRLNDGEELQAEEDVRPEAIVQWANEADDDEYIQVRLVGELARVARERSGNNSKRAKRYDRVAWAARASLIATGAELLFAVALRV